VAVVGYINGEIIGMAGASRNYEKMWCMGYDVVPEHRNKGVAATLGKIITDLIIIKVLSRIVPLLGLILRQKIR